MSPDKPVFGDDGSDFLIISIPRPLLSLDGGWVCGVEAAFALPGWSLGPHGDAMELHAGRRSRPGRSCTAATGVPGSLAPACFAGLCP